MRTISLGDKIGYWTVLENSSIHTRSGKGKLFCRCICGTEKTVWKSHLLNGSSKSCGCKGPKRANHYKWTGCGDLDGNHWNQIVRNATGKKARGSIALDITIQDAWHLFQSQGRRCALSGLPIILGKQRTASLDRINSHLGYTLDNVQWVHKDINKMKNTFPQDYFVEMCMMIANFQSQQNVPYKPYPGIKEANEAANKRLQNILERRKK